MLDKRDVGLKSVVHFYYTFHKLSFIYWSFWCWESHKKLDNEWNNDWSELLQWCSLAKLIVESKVVSCWICCLNLIWIYRCIRQYEFLMLLFRYFILLIYSWNQTSLNRHWLLKVIQSYLIMLRRLALNQSLWLMNCRNLRLLKFWISNSLRINWLWPVLKQWIKS